MKKFIKKFWGVGLIVIILSSLFVAAAPVTAADPLRWESKSGAPSTIFNAITSTATVMDFAVAANAATMYAACGTKLFQSTNGGSTWTDITTRLPGGTVAGFTTNATWVALAPDDANIVAVVTTNGYSNNVSISTNGGTTFTDMVLTPAPTSTQTIKGLDISALVTGGFRYISAFGQDSTVAGNSVLYYYNYGAGVGGWRNAVVTATGGFTAPSNSANIDNIVAMQFSPNFASDYMAVALSESKGAAGVSGNLSLHVLSFNSKTWDLTATGAAYPITITSEPLAGAFQVNKASVGLGPDYSGGDETLRIAFVGADITAATATGGIWRVNDVAAARNLLSGVGIASVAFDGTNLAAGAYASNNAYHCSDPLASSPTVLGARTFKRIGIDDPAANDTVNLMYVGATLFGSKQGRGGAISKSLDAGNTWNDYTLIKMDIGVASTWDDILVSGDGATWYVAIHDASTSSIFRMSPMQRVLCTDYVAPATLNEFKLRGVATDANVVYAYDYLGNTIFYSADGGVSRWQQRLNTPSTIGDLAVESANVIYFGSSSAPDVYKSINNGFTWNTAVNTNLTSGGNVYSILSLKENYVLVGGTAGAAAFSKDGGTTWTKLGPGIVGGAGSGTLVAATGLDTGNFIFTSPVNGKAVYRCEIGPSNPPYESKDMNLTAAFPQTVNAEMTTGMVLQSGVLYVTSANSTAGTPTYLNSILTPAMNPGSTVPQSAWRTQFSSAAFNTYGLTLNAVPNALRVSVSTGKITLWAVNTYGLATPGTISKGVRYFDDTLALVGPTLTGPADKALVQTNSISGNPLVANLTWNRISLATSYDVQVSLDSAFNSLFINSVGYVGADGTRDAMAMILTTATGLSPGSTYYWRVRANTPLSSAWSEARSFTVQPVAAPVPSISSPANGATITNQSPAFSWSPVTGTTKYEFQLSTTPTFGTTVLTDTPASAGTLVPVTIKLDQGKQYFWRVRASEPIQGDWSTVANFLVAAPPTSAPPPVTVTNVPAPTITIPPASPVPAITLNPPKVEQIAPSYIWAIIIIGGILVIAVIVLIVRTRRSV